LPPIGVAHSSDAIQAHSAALQHEVSVQKIALSSLQGEHDKLLAAFSRSQTRAAALEKKHAVSDSEIISLSEEKMRLQTQVVELERDVEELSRTRDEFRQAAVQEGAQYVEIVKKASQLEELAAEERKSWSKMRAEMEKTIEALRAGASASEVALRTAAILPIAHVINDVDTPASSVEAPSDLNIEPTADTRPTSHPKEFLQESNEELKEEIRRLRSRCAEVETALRAVRNDSRNMEGIVEALGLAGKSILERADRALGSAAED
jgi:chromosome segregation ATPase